MARQTRSVVERREAHAAVDDVQVVVEAAARFLEARPRSVVEVRRRLVSAGYRPTLVEEAIERLGDLGYLDDEAFARAWIESRDRARPRGERALRQELALKGIDRETIELTLGERRAPGEGDEAIDVDLAAATHLLQRNARSLAREPDERRRRQKAYALLARSGFSPDVCSEAARGFGEGGGGDEP